MRPIECIIIVVDRERRRFPARCRRMAHGTIRRDIQCYVIGIGACVEIGRMTARTCIGCIRVIALVTSITIVCNGDMRSCKGINRIVVKGGWHPSRFRVAQNTISWELCGRMVGISRLRVISVVTTVASIRSRIVITVVAYRAIIANSCMRPVERIIIVVDRERRWLPARGRRVAHGAIRRER